MLAGERFARTALLRRTLRGLEMPVLLEGISTGDVAFTIVPPSHVTSRRRRPPILVNFGEAEVDEQWAESNRETSAGFDQLDGVGDKRAISPD